MEQLVEDIRLGVALGLIAAAMLTLLALLDYFGSGAESWHETYPNWSLPEVEGMYAVLGIGLGVLGGCYVPSVVPGGAPHGRLPGRDLGRHEPRVHLRCGEPAHEL